MAGLLTPCHLFRTGVAPQRDGFGAHRDAVTCHDRHEYDDEHQGGRGRHRYGGYLDFVDVHDLWGIRPPNPVVAILQGTERDTGLISTCWRSRPISEKSEEIRQVRGFVAGRRFAHPGRPGAGRDVDQHGNQLREQALPTGWMTYWPRFRVYADLGYIPLVTPTSQIVGSQAVLNVLTGERYQEHHQGDRRRSQGRVWGHAGAVDSELQARVLGDAGEPITCRPRT